MSHSPIENLRIWKEGMALAKDVYQYTSSFPKEEIYGLTSQMRRSAVSISSNIAEGSQRATDKDFAHFIVIARGSCAELKTQIILSKELGYGNDDKAKELTDAIQNLNNQIGAFYKRLTIKTDAGG